MPDYKVNSLAQTEQKLDQSAATQHP